MSGDSRKELGKTSGGPLDLGPGRAVGGQGRREERDGGMGWVEGGRVGGIPKGREGRLG
jgi:hypothetical protein